jgi:hypothetical protein
MDLGWHADGRRWPHRGRIDEALVTNARERSARFSVLAVASVALLAKAWLAWRTTGQEDTYVWWPKFMQAVHEAGPIHVYATEMVGQPYNHPPLTGWWLFAIDIMHRHLDVPLGFLIRIGSIVADLLCGWLIFEILRRRRPLWQATAAGMLVGASPVFYVISGYHGNHDSEIMFLAILSAFLLVDKKWPVAAGVALAASVSLKLPAATVVPVVIAAAYAIDRRTLARFAIGFGALMSVLWLPPLLMEPKPFIKNVLLYSGNSFPRQWGIVEFMHVAHVPTLLSNLYVTPGRLIIIALCAAVGSWVALRRPDHTVGAIGLAMAAFLLLSPGYAPQYMAWPVAAIYALSFWPATAYNFAAGAFLIGLYTAWSGGLPWNSTWTVGLTHPQIIEAALVWLVLAAVVVHGALILQREAGLPRWHDLWRELRAPTWRTSSAQARRVVQTDPDFQSDSQLDSATTHK